MIKQTIYTWQKGGLARMKLNKKKTVKTILLTVLALTGAYFLWQNSPVHFRDENMGKVICNTIGGGVTPETVRRKDLKRVTYLDIGCVGNYETLLDIGKCVNIKDMTINGGNHPVEPAYEVTHDGWGRPLTEEDSARLQEELETVVPKLKELKRFSYSVYTENSDIENWDFLQSCSKLVFISIYSSKVSEYSFLGTFQNLKKVSLWGSQIETADSLVNMQDPLRLNIFDTPLSENEDEIQRLCTALPNTEILVNSDRTENEQEYDLRELYNLDD